MVPREDLINRRTEFRFAGRSIKLDLSLGLFSSAGVDTGSMLLLKTIAQSVDLDGLSRVLDVGCGVGTLGLAVAVRCPESQVVMVDRDALAVSFAGHNAALNGRTNTESHCRLMTEGPHDSPYQLVMSNIPAKAGESVIKDYLAGSLELLAPGGRGAVVIVHTLAERCRELIENVGGVVILEDASKQHTVFHYEAAEERDSSGGASPAFESGIPLSPYIRHRGEFKLKRTRYELDTVWNIGDFDSHSWRIRLMGEMLDADPIQGSMAFWAPGQGHLPVSVCRRRGARPKSVMLADRDRLALLITERNLSEAVPGVPVRTSSLSDPSLLGETVHPGTIDFLLTDITPVPRSDWTISLRDAASNIVSAGGLWAVLGRSADMAALTRGMKGWTPLTDRRNKGWRALIYRRNS